jgi:hypothetical protein
VNTIRIRLGQSGALAGWIQLNPEQTMQHGCRRMAAKPQTRRTIRSAESDEVARGMSGMVCGNRRRGLWLLVCIASQSPTCSLLEVCTPVLAGVNQRPEPSHLASNNRG